MKSKLIYPMVLVVFAAGCGGRGSARNAAQQQYETVQEGSAAGVTSTIQGPGETLPPITGTNADTTTAFALNPAAVASAPVPGGALPSYPGASATPPPMMSSAPPPSYSAPSRPATPAPQQASQQPVTQPAPVQPAPTQTAEPQPAAPAEATEPATETDTAAPAEQPKKEEPPPPAEDTSGSQAEEPPPPPPPSA